MSTKNAISPIQLAAILFCALGNVLNAQQATRIADLNPGGVGSFPSNFTAYGNALIFSAYTYEVGRELWKYDGNVITLVSNINDATHDDGGVQAGNDSVPYGFTVFNGILYFTAYDQRRGGELWSFDGTHTVRVADINPDLNDQIKMIQNSSWPQELTVFNNALYFSADKGGGTGGNVIQNFELHRYDGTRVNLVTNIHTDIGTNHSSYPNQLTVFNNALYFMADDGVNGYELWKHDGEGTVLFANINPGGAGSGSFPRHFTAYKDRLYFQAYDATRGFELWQTDGTNVSVVADLNPTGSSAPEQFTVYQNALFFCANDGTNGIQIWKYDGSSLTRISQFTPGYAPRNFTLFQDALYFAADDGMHGWELWRYDGLSIGMAGDLNAAGDSFPEDLMVWNNRLYFTATNGAVGYELWSYDGSSASTYDIFPGPASSFPFNLGGYGWRLCFSANDSWFYDWEPWSLATSSEQWVVSPEENLSAWGYVGGVLSSRSKNYTLTNLGTGALNWTASNAQNWVSLSAAGGTLDAGASTSVTVLINAQAGGLGVGSYTDAVSFINTTAGSVITRQVNLQLESLRLAISRSPVNIGSYQIAFPGHKAFTYNLEGSSNLAGWTVLTTNVVEVDATINYEEPQLDQMKWRFYRVRVSE